MAFCFGLLAAVLEVSGVEVSIDNLTGPGLR